MCRTNRQRWKSALNVSLKSENLRKTSPYFRFLAWTLKSTLELDVLSELSSRCPFVIIFCLHILVLLQPPLWHLMISFIESTCVTELSTYELLHDKTNKMTCAPSEDSDQPGHSPSLIRVFTVRIKKACVLSSPLSGQQRLWSDWTDAQADLSLRMLHCHFVGFVMRRLIICSNIWMLYHVVIKSYLCFLNRRICILFNERVVFSKYTVMHVWSNSNNFLKKNYLLTFNFNLLKFIVHGSAQLLFISLTEDFQLSELWWDDHLYGTWLHTPTLAETMSYTNLQGQNMLCCQVRLRWLITLHHIPHCSKNCCSYPKKLNKVVYHWITHPKDADRMANSVDPDQTASDPDRRIMYPESVDPDHTDLGLHCLPQS